MSYNPLISSPRLAIKNNAIDEPNQGLSHWLYTSPTDALAVASAPGYFTNAQQLLMKTGDIVEIFDVTNSITAFYYISSFTNGVPNLTLISGTAQALAPAFIKAQKSALVAQNFNLVRNAVTSVATITSPSTAPSTTGYTNYFAQGTGYVASFTASTIFGSPIINVSSATSLVVGQPLVENTSTAVYPSYIPMGALIKSINGTVVTMTKNALGTTPSPVTVRAASQLVNYIGGVASNYGGNLTISGSTAGNSVNPPTAPYIGYDGGAIEFMTDVANFNTSSVAIIFQVYLASSSPTSYRIAIDDSYQSANPVAYNASTGTQYVTIQFASAGEHKVRIEFANAAATGPIDISSLYIYSPGTIWSPVNPYTVNAAFYSDSYCAGAASGNWPERNIAAQTAILLGWNHDNLAVGGTGYTTGGATNYAFSSTYRLNDLNRKTYDVVVFFGSVNDAASSAGVITAQALATYQAARAILPSATFFVFGCPTTNNTSSSTATIIENAVSAAVTAFADQNTYFIPITTDVNGNWITTGNASTYIASDGTHLTDPAGTTYYAYKMARAINNILQIGAE